MLLNVLLLSSFIVTLPVDLCFGASVAKSSDGGAPPEVYSSNARIIGGTAAKLGQFPYQVSLRNGILMQHYCGGSLIKYDTVLTAAHCIKDQQVGSITVVAGVVAYSTIVSSLNKRGVNKITWHKSFDSKTLRFDIGIIKLSSPFGASSYIKTIALQDKDVSSGSSTVSGWGQTSIYLPLPSTFLMYVNVNIVERKQCNIIFNGTIYNEMICAGTTTGSCNGDSGGPLVYNGNLFGIVSGGVSPCNNKVYPHVFTSVPALRSWILANSI